MPALKFIITLVQLRDMERLQSKYIEIDEELEKKFKLISTRNATFYAMTADEKLEVIVNLIENLLKKDDKYLKLNYSELCGEFLSDECVKSYREKLQCLENYIHPEEFKKGL